jgi:hypothetical protein
MAIDIPHSTTGTRPTVFVPQLGWRAGPRACRSLSAAGFRVIGGQDEARSERARFRRARLAYQGADCSSVLEYPSPGEQPEAFLAAVARICEQHDVTAVLPVDDEVVHLLAAYLPRPGGAVFVGPTIEQFRQLADKGALGVLAGQAGFAQPPAVVVGPGGPQDEWPSLPSMVKPRVTGAETRRGLVSRKPVLVCSEEERDRAVGELVETVGEALVEEQVRGDAWRVHFVRDTTRTITLTLRALRNYPPNTGQGSVLRVAPPPAGLVPAAERLLELVDYRGPGSIQVIEREGRFFVHDVNLRLPLTVGGTIRAGFDMPRLAVEAALGIPLEARPLEIGPATYVFLDGELHHLLDGLRGRETQARAPRVAADLVLAAVKPSGVLDPFLLRHPSSIALAFLELFQRHERRAGERGGPETASPEEDQSRKSGALV